MPNYFYNDANGQTQGPFDLQQLQNLADQGIIMPTSPLATDGGHTGLAGQIPGLRFKTAAPPPFQTAQVVPTPVPKQLFCTNCGNSISEQAVACMSCGAKPVGHRKFCRQCAAALNPEQVVCVRCGAGVKTAGVFDKLQSVGGGTVSGSKSKVTAGLLGILLGGVGAHKFYMGSWGWGLLFIGNLFVILPLTAVLSITVVLAPLFFLSLMLASVQGICGLIEGIIYLTMSDEAFAEKYPSETQSPFRW